MFIAEDPAKKPHFGRFVSKVDTILVWPPLFERPPNRRAAAEALKHKIRSRK